MVRVDEPLLLAITMSPLASRLSPALLYQLRSGVGTPRAVHLKVAASASFFVWHSGVTLMSCGVSGIIRIKTVIQIEGTYCKHLRKE